MMVTNSFVIVNVKQLRTGGSFRISLPFFRTSWGVGVPNSAIFNSFHNRVEFGTILEDLRNFGRGLNPPNPRPSVRHWTVRTLQEAVRHRHSNKYSLLSKTTKTLHQDSVLNGIWRENLKTSQQLQCLCHLTRYTIEMGSMTLTLLTEDSVPVPLCEGSATRQQL